MKEIFSGDKDFKHDEIPSVGILLANLGTPDAATTPALRRYLREFLSDQRVIELPKWKWQIILNLFILTTRPKKSAEAYREVWTEDGSPLLQIGLKQRDLFKTEIKEVLGTPIAVELGMRYGNPSIASALQSLRDQGARKILVLPLYPQYSATTTASTFDAVADELKNWRWVPEFRMITQYHDHAGYINALCNSIKESWEQNGRNEKLLFSFHGVPKRYITGGDPYYCHCQKTARLVAEQLGLKQEEYLVCFQSIFGKEEWIKPATDKTIIELAKGGLKSLDVICPGFSADCLETIEEIEGENREYFEENGGEKFNYIPALNEREDHVDALVNLTLEHLQGWVKRSDEWSQDAAKEQAAATQCIYANSKFL